MSGRRRPCCVLRIHIRCIQALGRRQRRSVNRAARQNRCWTGCGIWKPRRPQRGHDVDGRDAERIAVDKQCKKDADCVPIKARACGFACTTGAVPKAQEKEWNETVKKGGQCKKWNESECAKLDTRPAPTCHGLSIGLISRHRQRERSIRCSERPYASHAVRDVVACEIHSETGRQGAEREREGLVSFSTWTLVGPSGNVKRSLREHFTFPSEWKISLSSSILVPQTVRSPSFVPRLSGGGERLDLPTRSTAVQLARALL